MPGMPNYPVQGEPWWFGTCTEVQLPIPGPILLCYNFRRLEPVAPIEA
jgi:hypothetical protein